MKWKARPTASLRADHDCTNIRNVTVTRCQSAGHIITAMYETNAVLTRLTKRHEQRLKRLAVLCSTSSNRSDATGATLHPACRRALAVYKSKPSSSLAGPTQQQHSYQHTLVLYKPPMSLATLFAAVIRNTVPLRLLLLLSSLLLSGS